MTKCANKECPSRITCLRYMAVPVEQQKYEEYQPEGERCGEFVSIEAG